jgi:hypothetical protein
MIWATLGFSVGLVGLFCLFLGLVAAGTTWYESHRVLAAASLTLPGLVLLLRAWANARRCSRTAFSQVASSPRPSQGDPSEGDLTMRSPTYWGLMLVLFGLAALLFHPLHLARREAGPPQEIVRPGTPPPPAKPQLAPAPPSLAPIPTTKPPPRFRVQGLIYTPQQVCIIVNGKPWSVGDNINGVDLVEITPQSVTVRYGDQANQWLYTWFAR